MTWGFIWLMFILKIPIIGLLSIVWWAIKSSDEEPRPEETVRPVRPPRPHPPRRPKRRRPRGPHGDPAAVPSPPRVRPVSAVARGRSAREHRSDR